MRSLFFYLISTLLMGGCITRPLTEEQKQLPLYELSAWEHFSIRSPLEFNQKIERADGSVSWVNYDTRAAHRKDGDVLLEEYVIVDSECTSPLMGASQMEPLANGLWGRVDFWDHYQDYIPGTEPICGTWQGQAYVFCSEKDTQTVVICISGKKDDPELAQKIFETFQWTD